MGLKRAVYETPYENAERSDLPVRMTLLDTVQVKYDFALSDPSEIQSLFTMTPYYYRTSREDM
jgi:23S rRNA (guanine745-N1)-methyltransferase